MLTLYMQCTPAVRAERTTGCGRHCRWSVPTESIVSPIKLTWALTATTMTLKTTYKIYLTDDSHAGLSRTVASAVSSRVWHRTGRCKYGCDRYAGCTSQHVPGTSSKGDTAASSDRRCCLQRSVDTPDGSLPCRVEMRSASDTRYRDCGDSYGIWHWDVTV